MLFKAIRSFSIIDVNADFRCIITVLKLTPGRWQSKTPLTIGKHGSKVARNSVFDCYLSPVRSKTLFLTILDLRLSIVLTFSIAVYPVYGC